MIEIEMDSSPLSSYLQITFRTWYSCLRHRSNFFKLRALLMESMNRELAFDVIIIGAGLSGLSAGNYLLEHDHETKFIILEARDRVGGRTYAVDFDGRHLIDLGGAYVGPYQNRILRLAREFKLGTYKVNIDGKHVYTFAGDQRLEYTSVLPIKINPFAMLDVNYLVCRTHELSERVSSAVPWSNEQFASMLDRMTIEDWITSVAETEHGKEMYRVIVRTILCVEPCEVSMLSWLSYVNSGLGILRLCEATNGAQERKFKGGAYKISERLHEKLSEDRVRLGHVVKTVRWSFSSFVEVECTNGKRFSCRHIIIALAPSLYKTIEFEPALPTEKCEASARMYMGSVIKTITVYQRPFWKERGFSGTLLDTSGEGNPVVYAYDDSSVKNDFYAIMGSILANSSRAWRKKTRDERQKAVCQQYAHAFKCDEMVTACQGYIEHDWSAEVFSGGCYGDIMPTELLTSLRDQLRISCKDQLFFAGTELAVRWTGYMDGAVEAGERAAFEIITKHLKPRRGEDRSQLKWVEEEPVDEEEDCRPPKGDKLMYGPSRIEMMLPRGSTLTRIFKVGLVTIILYIAFVAKNRFNLYSRTTNYNLFL